ncbi:MAG: cupin domain-containing protein, partial [Hungatella sp.]
SPSIATLMDILQCLGTSIGEFFNETPEEQIVFDKSDYFEKHDAELQNTVQWIIPNAQKNMMEPIMLSLEPGGETYPDNPHEGEEFGYILSGSVSIHIGNKLYRAKKGESFYFISDKKHYLTSKTGATLLWVSSPPSF